MLSPECLGELRTAWLPNAPDLALDRLIELLDKASPLLISGCFTRAIPQGCLATHIAWSHPDTEHLCIDAGITWLSRVAKLNPATSHVLREWDLRGATDVSLRRALLAELSAEREARRARCEPTRTLVPS
jgi:hypothetical protein